MRTGFIGLNSYLHKIKRVESPIAAGESGYQTDSHILGDCYLEGFAPHTPGRCTHYAMPMFIK